MHWSCSKRSTCLLQDKTACVALPRRRESVDAAWILPSVATTEHTFMDCDGRAVLRLSSILPGATCRVPLGPHESREHFTSMGYSMSHANLDPKLQLPQFGRKVGVPADASTHCEIET